MKIVKFGAIALALGLFAASCNNETATTETTTTDTAVTTAPMEAAPVVVDTTAVVPAAGTDTVKMETKTTTETKEVK